MVRDIICYPYFLFPNEYKLKDINYIIEEKYNIIDYCCNFNDPRFALIVINVYYDHNSKRTCFQIKRNPDTNFFMQINNYNYNLIKIYKINKWRYLIRKWRESTYKPESKRVKTIKNEFNQKLQKW